MDLHKQKEGAAPDIKAGASPAEMLAFEHVLAERIKTARATAKQGEIFTRDVVPVFKQTFADYYQRRTGRELRLLFDEVPNFKPQVNGTYPVNAAKATSPPRLSLALPTLTDELEYRLWEPTWCCATPKPIWWSTTFRTCCRRPPNPSHEGHHYDEQFSRFSPGVGCWSSSLRRKSLCRSGPTR
jgi:hypothetical protein